LPNEPPKEPLMTLVKESLVQFPLRSGRSLQAAIPDPDRQCFELIKKSLESGEDVLISGFGKFIVKKKAQRRGRNPATGGDLTLDARRVVTFKCSGVLRKKMGGEG
jgi:integration host factor subunit alpha